MNLFESIFAKAALEAGYYHMIGMRITNGTPDENVVRNFNSAAIKMGEREAIDWLRSEIATEANATLGLAKAGVSDTAENRRIFTGLLTW
jgi:hypothetical protein